MRRPSSFSLLLMSAGLSACLCGCGRAAVPGKDRGKPTKVSDLFFEILRYDVTGNSTMEGIEKFAHVSLYPRQVLLNASWMPGRNPVYAVENAVPSYCGRIDSSFSADTFKTSETYGWIDALLEDVAASAAAESIEALEMKQPQQLQQESPDSAASDGGKGSKEEESPSEERYRDAEGRLKMYAYGPEVFSVSEGKDGKRVMISSEGGKTVRKYFDAMMRLEKKETWKIGSSSSESGRDRTDTYYYNGEELKPFSSVMQQKDVRVESLYDDKGRMYAQKKYTIDDEGVRRLESQTLWKYNEAGKVTEEEYTVFQYSPLKKKVQTGKYVQKEVYDYSVHSDMPDYYYYEDGVLHMKTLYGDDGSYVTTLYFDDNFSVVTEYNHGRKLKETVLHGSRIERSRKYE